MKGEEEEEEELPPLPPLPGMLAHAWNLSTGEVKVGESMSWRPV